MDGMPRLSFMLSLFFRLDTAELELYGSNSDAYAEVLEALLLKVREMLLGDAARFGS